MILVLVLQQSIESALASLMQVFVWFDIEAQWRNG